MDCSLPALTEYSLTFFGSKLLLQCFLFFLMAETAQNQTCYFECLKAVKISFIKWISHL